MRARLAAVARDVRRSFTTAPVWRNAQVMGGARDAGVAGRLPSLARTHPDLWTALREQQSSAVAALGARFQLLSHSLNDEDYARRMALVRTACTHPSVVQAQEAVAELPLARDELEEIASLREPIAHNAQLATLGNALLGLVASEHFHLKYPHLPTRVLKAFVSAYVGPSTLADVGSDLGVLAQGVQRWDRSHQRGDAKLRPKTPLLSKDVAAQSVRALVSVVFQELGIAAARNFIHSHFLSRKLDLTDLLKFKDPKRVLSETCRKYNRPSPQSRMIAETGRLSISPVFVVGVWSGSVKIGEASGSSIRMAEFRAAENALRRLYLAELPDGTFDLPSSTLDDTFLGAGPIPRNLLDASPADSRTYSPQPLGRSETLHASRG